MKSKTGRVIAGSAIEPTVSGIHAVKITLTNPTTTAAITGNKRLRVMARTTRKPSVT